MFFPGGGIGRYANELLNAISEIDGVGVELVCSPDFEYQDSARYKVAPILQGISAENPIKRKAKFLTAQFRNPRKLIDRAVERRVDVLHFSNINHLSYSIWRRAVRKGPFAMTASVHDVRRQAAILCQPWETYWLRRFYQDCDALFAHGEYQKEDLIRFASVDPSNVHIVPHGIYEYPAASATKSELRCRYKLPTNRPVGLFFGAIRDDKNLDNLLISLAKAETQVSLLIAGRPRNDSMGIAIRQRIAELGVGESVTFLDRFIPEEEVGDLFAVSDFVALTYRTSFTSQSGVLNVAAHYGRPILTTPAPLLRDTVDAYSIGVVCSSDSSAAIASGICSILEPGDWATAFAKYRNAHDWRTNANLTVDVFRQLARGQRAN